MRRLVAAVLATTALASACGTSQASERTVTVFAAASLNRAFTAAGAAFEGAHPGTRVRFSFAGSQALAAQVQQGAPADVLATADAATLQQVAGQLTGPGRVFAHNQLALITAPGNPLRLTSPADLARPGLKVVLAAPTVPIGALSRRVLAAAGVSLSPVSWEDSVTGVVTKVRLGEADAGLAYATDLGPGVGGVAVPGTSSALSIGVLDANGAAFASFILSPAGQAVLREFGFR